MRPLLLHSEFIETSIREITPKAAFVFGAAICQRVWPVFKMSFKRNEGSFPNDLASKLSAVWESLAGSTVSPAPIAPAFEEAIPSTEVAQGDIEFFDSAAALYGFASSFDRASPEGMLYVSDTVLALVDNFLYKSLNIEVNAGNDLIIDSHPLVLREISRQKADLSELTRSTGRGTILSIWARSKEEHLLDLVE